MSERGVLNLYRPPSFPHPQILFQRCGAESASPTWWETADMPTLPTSRETNTARMTGCRTAANARWVGNRRSYAAERGGLAYPPLRGRS